MPGTGFVGDPGLTGNCSMPRQLAQMDQPVCVCHQWSMTGTLRLLAAHRKVSGSQRSPARKGALKFERSYLLLNASGGSSFLMGGNGVGAVRWVFAFCWVFTSQYAHASG